MRTNGGRTTFAASCLSRTCTRTGASGSTLKTAPIRLNGGVLRRLYFKVVRRQGGATIWIAKPAGAEQAGYRMLEFDKNAFTTNDGGRVQWERQSDNWSVGIDGREFYFIPDALIYGG